jgi:hypothetical protein
MRFRFTPTTIKTIIVAVLHVALFITPTIMNRIYRATRNALTVTSIEVTNTIITLFMTNSIANNFVWAFFWRTSTVVFVIGTCACETM